MYTLAELEKMYEVALLQRKQAYAKKMPKFVISSINYDLANIRKMMQEVSA